MNLGVCNSTELETTQRSINRKADKHILVYLYHCAAMRRKNVSLHRVIRKVLANLMQTERSQEKGKQAICFYLYKVQRQAKGISASRGQAIGYLKGEKLCLEGVFGEGASGAVGKDVFTYLCYVAVGSSSQTTD